MTTTNLRFVAKNGLDNNGNTIVNLGAAGASLGLVGANALTITTTGPTSVTFPTSGTLATLASSVANATTANTLATPRTINGVSFDGSANITIVPSTVANGLTLGTTNAAVSLVGIAGTNAPMSISAGPNSANGNGNSLTISAGAGVGSTGSGGSLTITSGNTGATGSGVAGNITIHADNTGGGTTGGAIAIRGGNTPSNGASGGSVTISGGNSSNGATSGAGGNVSLAGGTSATATPGSLFFYTANAERMRITSTGALLLAGTAGTAGQVLTSDTNGVPSWATPSAGAATALNGTGAYSTTPQNATGVYAGINASWPRVFFSYTAAATGKRSSQIYNNGTNLVWTFVNDASTAETPWLTVGLPTNNASQAAPTVTLNTTYVMFGDGASTVTPAAGSATAIQTGAVSSFLSTPNVATAVNNMLIMPGQNTSASGAGATVWVSGALRNNAGTAGTAALIGGQNTSTGVAGDVVVAGGNQTGSASGAGGNAFIYGGQGGASGAGGYISLQTPQNNTQTERLRILNNGAWSVGSSGTAYGTSGQVLTSNGNAAPSWQSVSATALGNATVLGTTAAATSLTGFAGATAPMTIAAGAGTTTGNSLSLTASAAATATNAGGAVNISAGNGLTSGAGGNVVITAGTSPSGTAGSINLNAAIVNVSNKLVIGNSITVGSTPSEGTAGQVLTSAGPGNPPNWSSPGVSGSTLKGRVYLNSAANSTNAGWQKVPLATVQYDTASIWNSTSNRFIPNQAGYYQVNGRARFGTQGGTALAIAKNGVQTQGIGGDSGSTSVLGEGGSGMIFCNGTTDYIELFVYATAARAFTTGSFDTFLEIYGPL